MQDGGDATDWPSASSLRDACARIPGAPILEVSASTIQDYACGTFALVERDINEVLGATAVAAVEATVSQAAPVAATKVKT